jgi:hypothetical protein
VPIVLKSGSLNLLKPSGAVQACNGIALPLPFKCLLCIYVLPQDGPRRPKHVGEIIMKILIFMHEYLQLVGINRL